MEPEQRQNIWEFANGIKRYKVLFFLCVLWFGSLCLAHFFSGRAPWLDEEFIIDNIRSLQFNQITGPLKNCQAFPRLYLVIIKSFASAFNFNVLAMRLLPLICMLLAFAVWLKVYKRACFSRISFFLCAFSCAASYRLIYYAAEIKQYSMDILISGLFTLCIIRQGELENHAGSLTFIRLAIFAALLIPLSYCSIFFFWIICFNFLRITLKNKACLPGLFTYCILSISLLGLFYLFDIRYGLSQNCLYNYWNDYFLCSQSPYCFIKSFGEGLQRLVFWFFADTRLIKIYGSFFIPLFIISLVACGISYFKQKRRAVYSLEAITFFIFLELIFFGILKKYPFTGERITLFFAPFVFFLLVKGIMLLRKIRPVYLGAAALYCGFLALAALNALLKILKLF